jgi:flagellar L-ring protein precursor FlgH
MKLLLIVLAGVLTACSHAPTKGLEPVAMPQMAKAETLPPPSGTILRDSREFSLFEDNRPTRVGDTLIVMINENVNASKKAKTSTDRKSDISMSVPTATAFPGSGDLGKIGIKGSAQNKFDGGGETSANNVFSGTITALVSEVHPNGLLLISGTKQISLHGEAETLRFSGIVNPRHIQSNGSVSSQHVAEVRLKYEGAGQINESLFMGWAARIFLNVLPL